jgi:hypothetical protein
MSRRHSMIRDDHSVRSVRRLVEEDVDHVATLVKQRCKLLDHARLALPECHVTVELLLE